MDEVITLSSGDEEEFIGFSAKYKQEIAKCLVDMRRSNPFMAKLDPVREKSIKARKVAVAVRSKVTRNNLNSSPVAGGSGTYSRGNESAIQRLDRQIELFLAVILPSNLKKVSVNSVSIQHHKELELKLRKKRTFFLNETQEVQLKFAEMLAKTTKEIKNATEFDIIWKIIGTLLQNSKVEKLRAEVVDDLKLRGAGLMDKCVEKATFKDKPVQTPVFEAEMQRMATPGLTADNAVVVDTVEISDEEEEEAVPNLREEIKRKKILDIEKMMTETLSKTIKELETQEVDFNDIENLQNTPFIRAKLYEKKYMELYRGLCDVSGASYLTDRLVHKKINITNCSDYPEFEKVVQDYLNSKGLCLNPPDFARVHQLISSHNEKAELKYDQINIKNIAENLHLVVIEKFRSRRLMDTTYVRLALPQFPIAGDTNVILKDPADMDPNLARKLEENRKTRKSEQDVLNSFLVQLENVMSDNEIENVDPSFPVSDTERDDDEDTDSGSDYFGTRDKEPLWAFGANKSESSNASIIADAAEDRIDSSLVLQPPAKKLKFMKDGDRTTFQ